MRLTLQFSLLIVLYIFYSIAFSQEVQNLVELLSSIHTLQGDFVQTVLDNKGKPIQKSIGKMSLERPGHFRWQVYHPIPQLIIANDTRLWIYDPDLQQVVIHSMAKAAGETPAFLLTNVTQALKKDFIIRRMSAPRNWIWYSLTPKNQSSMYHNIQLGFFNHDIKEMRMKDNLGHYTVIQFQHLRKNVTLSASLFNFHPPANVDVIDETH